MPADPRATDVSPVAGDDIEKGSTKCVALGGVLFVGVTAVGLIVFLLGQDDPATDALTDQAALCGTLSHQAYDTAVEACAGDAACEAALPHYWNSDAGCVYFSGAAPP
jgi:hypothetical protein